MTRKLLLSVITLFAGAWSSHATVQPHALFTDGCVLQRGMSVPVWGQAKAGAKVTVEFRGQKVEAVADANSKWMVWLKKMDAGGPFTMTIRGDNTITLTNVCLGEVWVCSGQSNMGFALSNANNAAAAIAASTDPQFRLFKVPLVAAESPQGNVTATWQASDPTSAAKFSAVAYFFGRDLRKQLGVPVGLIESAVGGTPAAAWTDHATLESDPVLRAMFDRYAAIQKDYDQEKAKVAYLKARERYKQVAAKAKAEGKTPPRAPRAPRDPVTGPKRPSVLYNGMIAPLEPFAICGAIWYQGESNAQYPKEYQTLFPAMIGCWRKAWGLGNFPFLFVQIAPHQGQPPEIREAQFITLQKTKNTAMAVITDLGNATNIHPTDKEPVGGRLALAARALAYGEKIEYSGPVYKKMKVKDGKAILSFTHVGNGLEAKNGVLKGFTVAAVASTNFVPAEATIVDDTVVVQSTVVKQPGAVRYGWANVPDVNLFNKEGLPATPFRTDPE